MKSLLIVLTLIEVALLVVVLAVYLIVIAAKLQRVSKTLGLVTFGVRAIEKQTQPIGPVLADINGALEAVAGALEGVVAGTAARPPAPPPEELPVEPHVGPEVQTAEPQG